ncbi:hypothetical protein LD39_17995, partial [Halobacillus sp. BBL2006]
TTALGAAFLAGLAVGYWKDKEEIKEQSTNDRTFTGDMSESEQQELYGGWQKAVEATRKFK